MKNLILALILAIISSLEPNFLIAQYRIYVHPDLGVDLGNDGRNISNPIRTLYRAGQVCHGLDTIFIRGGIFTAYQDTFYQQDTSGLNPIWIMPYFNESVILDGNGYNFQSWEAILNVVHSRNVIIENLHLRNNLNGGAGIRIVSEDNPLFITKDVLVKNCLIHDIFRQGILIQANNVTIDKCEIYNAVLRNINGLLGDSGWEVALGTYLWPNTINCWTNIVFKNNIIHNSWGEGIVALRCYNFLIENNHVYDCFSAYIYVDNSRKGVIRSNWIHSTNDIYNRHYNNNFYAPGIGIQWAAEQNSYGVDSLISDLDIYNNLIVRTNAPISWWRSPQNTYFNNSYENINVYYNTIYNTFGYEGFHLDVNTTGIYTPLNCNFKNNIICKGQYPLGSYQQYITPSSHYHNWQIDYNCFIHSDIPINIPISHNIEGSPSFIDSTNIGLDSNFKISSISNCRFTAVPINSINIDYWKALRNNNFPCIGFHEYGGISGTGFIENEMPGNYKLEQNFPNPFNPTTNLEFQIPKPGFVSLTVFDLIGKEIATVVKENLNPGKYNYKFNGNNISSGIYFYRFESNGVVLNKRMILIK